MCGGSRGDAGVSGGVGGGCGNSGGDAGVSGWVGDGCGGGDDSSGGDAGVSGGVGGDGGMGVKVMMDKLQVEDFYLTLCQV